MGSPISLYLISFLVLSLKISTAVSAAYDVVGFGARPQSTSYNVVNFGEKPKDPASYNVVDFGARPDGRTDSTPAFLRAWAAACSSWMPATMYVPAGKFFLAAQATFAGPCKNKAILVKIDGAILAPADYNIFRDMYYWIMFQHVEGVSIQGGVLDGQGLGLWACKASGNRCPEGVTTLEFSKSKDIVVSGLTSINSQKFHIVFHSCNNVKVDNIRVMAAEDSPNTDGVHVEQSTGFQILNSVISTGDDCVSIGPGSANLLVQNVICGPGHGISIGSLGRNFEEAGVVNVTVSTVSFSNTQNGVRIKTWGKPSTSFVKGVQFQHAKMINVKNPIIIDQNYCPNNEGCPHQFSGVKISDVMYMDVQGSSATEVAVKLDCSKSNPCSGITLEDVKLQYNNQLPKAMCVNAATSSRGYVEPAVSCV